MHARFLLAQATIFVTTTLHYEINIVPEISPSSPKISALLITNYQDEMNLMCVRFFSSINTRKQKHCKAK